MKPLTSMLRNHLTLWELRLRWCFAPQSGTPVPLMQLSNNETDVLESLLASWLFPYLIASGVTAQTVVEKLSPTPVGKYATGARLGARFFVC